MTEERVVARLQLPMNVDDFVTATMALADAHPDLLFRGSHGDSTVVELYLLEETHDQP